jgi:hypothetical protein
MWVSAAVNYAKLVEMVDEVHLALISVPTTGFNKNVIGSIVSGSHGSGAQYKSLAS